MSRMTLTAMRILGLDVKTFGGGSNTTSEVISDIMV
jgi:hypothetical protein